MSFSTTKEERILRELENWRTTSELLKRFRHQFQDEEEREFPHIFRAGGNSDCGIGELEAACRWLIRIENGLYEKRTSSPGPNSHN